MHTFLAILFSCIVVRVWVKNHLKKQETSGNNWYSVLLYTATGTHHLFSAIIACFVASLVLTIPKGIEELLYSAAIIALMLQLAVWGHRLITRWVDIRYQQSRETHPDSVSSIHILGLSARIILYAFYYP